MDAVDKMYVRADIGLFFLSLPESSPFIETDSNEELMGFLDHYDASHRPSPLFRLAVGGTEWDNPLLILFDSDKRVYYIEKFRLNIAKAQEMGFCGTLAGIGSLICG